jgi:hypothetical protein
LPRRDCHQTQVWQTLGARTIVAPVSPATRVTTPAGYRPLSPVPASSAGGRGADGQRGGDVAQNASIARSTYEAWNDRDFNRIAEVLAKGEVIAMGRGDRWEGSDGALQFAEMWYEGFPDGKICDVWSFASDGTPTQVRTYFDTASMMAQLGLLPQPAAAGATA